MFNSGFGLVFTTNQGIQKQKEQGCSGCGK